LLSFEDVILVGVVYNFNLLYNNRHLMIIHIILLAILKR
jgi:hypothetical protein